MDKFVENFNKFREFLNNFELDTPLTLTPGDVLQLIQDKFEELELNEAF